MNALCKNIGLVEHVELGGGILAGLLQDDLLAARVLGQERRNVVNLMRE